MLQASAGPPSAAQNPPSRALLAQGYGAAWVGFWVGSQVWLVYCTADAGVKPCLAATMPTSEQRGVPHRQPGDPVPDTRQNLPRDGSCPLRQIGSRDSLTALHP
jgi:hypothetical protein